MINNEIYNHLKNNVFNGLDLSFKNLKNIDKISKYLLFNSSLKKYI